jgi:thiol-disulfide isomerase/thioredoxin
MKQIIILLIFSVIMLAACSGNRTKEEKAAVTEVEQTSTDTHTAVMPSVPAFVIQDINGNNMNMQSIKNKKLFVNLWASWCPPCKREMPSIEKLYKSVDTAKVAFILLSLDDNFDKAKAYMRHQKLNLPLYYPTENLPPLFNVQGIPATFIFNEKGELLNRIEGATNYDADQFRKMLQ